jgi:PASTA domain
MQDTAATSTDMPERRGKPRRDGLSRLQTVGDYGGQFASEAAQAVRRAGLKPGLERSFGFAAELRGQIVAQEPEVGSELARNGLVTLYVAAPGAASAREQAEAGPAADEDPDVEVSARIVADAEPGSDRAGAVPRRRKSRRPPRGVGATFDAPPAPNQPTVGEATEPLSLDARDHGEVEDDRATEEYVIDADELFAGRASAATWRRVYPRRHSGLRSRLAGRSRLVLAALALLAVWLLVALAAALTGHRASPAPPPAHARARTQTPPLATVPVRPSEHHLPMPHREAARRHPAPKRRRPRRAPTQRPAQQPTQAVTAPPTAPTPTRPPPAPVGRDAEGGLFSP